MYKIINENQILRTADGAIIPICEKNRDYQLYLEWITDGNIAETLTASPPAPQTKFSKLQIVSAFEKLNKISVLNELLTNDIFNLYWTSANIIDINHAKTVQAIQQLNINSDNDLSGNLIIETIINS